MADRVRGGGTAISKARARVEQLDTRILLSLLGQQLFPADNPWNQNISQAPVAANSAAIMNNIISRYGDGRLHPDFGQDYRNSNDLYGIPYNVVHGNSVAKVSVVIDDYADESDIIPAPIPAGAVIEGDYQNGPNPNGRGDSHLIIWDQDNNIAYEFGNASRPSENPDDKWHASGEAVWDMKTNTFRTLGWTSVDAAGLPILPGLVRPDEGLPISQGGQGIINHAIRFTLQNAIILNQFIYPASHVANPGNTNPAIQPPMGARFRLKANVDISGLNPQARIIAQAMKDYGMIVADNGSNFFFTGASYAVDAQNNITLTWNDNDIQDTVHGLKSLHYSDFEVVDLTPAVTSISPATGPAGTAVTITGRNFSGAAGHLQVVFGSIPASSVTILDDGHLTAVAPAGLTGTADVRVQSGVTVPNNTQNIKGTIFGYGISATTSADRFATTASVPSPLTISGTAGADAIVVRPVSGAIEASVNGTVVASRDAALVSAISVLGYDGNDTITISPGVMGASVDGGLGDDSITGGGGADSIRGDAGNDTLYGGAGDDSLMGNTEDDRLYGQDGLDLLQGGLGADSLEGGIGNDSLYAGDQSDTVYGNEGDDYIEGRGKADTIYGGTGNDTIWGGAGNDLILAEDGDDRIDVGYYLFADTVRGGAGVDLIRSDDNDILENCEGPWPL